MSHGSLERRLRRLEREREAAGSDGSGLAPHSSEWVRFWARWAARRAAGEKPEPEFMTLEAFRALAGNDVLRVDRVYDIYRNSPFDISSCESISTITWGTF